MPAVAYSMRTKFSVEPAPAKKLVWDCAESTRKIKNGGNAE
jgi:hypothetical protein